MSIWWASVAGTEVDVRNEFVMLNTANGWRGRLSGPGTAPIAVAVVAACHGPAALLAHPGLACLRKPGTSSLSWAEAARHLERDGPKV